jgi:hypothetical protein
MTMSQYLNQIAVTQFDTMTKHDYQSMGVLRGLFRQRNGVKGSKTTFNRMGKGQASERTAPSSDVISMNIDHNKVEVTLRDWEASEYTDIFKQQEVLPDEVSELSTSIKGAIGRRRDQLCIDALAAGTYAAAPTDAEGKLVGTAVGGAASNMNIDKLIALKTYMDRKAIPKDGRCIAIHPDGMAGLLADTKVTSSDYANVKALVRGEIDTFMGFKFIEVPDMAEGGLPHGGAGTFPATGDLVDGFAWHRDAVGEAVGIEMQTSVDWIPHKKSHLSSGDFKGNAIIIDNQGVCKVQYTI